MGKDRLVGVVYAAVCRHATARTKRLRPSKGSPGRPSDRSGSSRSPIESSCSQGVHLIDSGRARRARRGGQQRSWTGSRRGASLLAL